MRRYACLPLILVVITGTFFFQARVALAQTVEPDDYADHQNISSAVAGITLSTLGDGFDSFVYAVDVGSFGGASTGTKVFGFQTASNVFGTRWDQEGFTLQATFSTLMGSVSLDFVLAAGSGNGQLLAFNAANVQIDAAFTPSGNGSTLTVSSASHDISYVRASFTNVQSADVAGLDHLVVMIPEPSVFGLLSAGLISSAVLLRKRIRGK
jgi:hypothetical protein